MADFLDEKRRRSKSGCSELQPLVDEFHRLEAAVAALDGRGAGAQRPRARATPPARRGAATRRRPRAAVRRAAARARTQALELVRARPGITIPELAERDGHQAELPVPRHAGPRGGGPGGEAGRGWHTRPEPQESPAGRLRGRRTRSRAASGGARLAPQPGRPRSARALRPRRAPRRARRGRVDPLARELVDLEALHDRRTRRPASCTGSRDDPLGHAVGAVRGDRHRDPVAVGRAVHPVVHVVDRGVGGRRRARRAARLDDRRAALLRPSG